LKKIAAALALVGLTFGLALPASAHAQLLLSNPRIGSSVYLLPSKIQLTFDDNLIDLGGSSNQIEVTDPKGKRIDSGATRVDGSALTVQLKPYTLLGKYEVTYRVISADGHPVSNSFPFYLEKKPTPKVTKKPAPKPTPKKK
jgi:methionine-rich copper-binding protein CopC